MKKFPFALLALAVALAISPVALADTWTYTISGTNFTSTLDLTGTDVGLVPGPSGNVNAFVITSVYGTFTDPPGTYTFGATTPVPAGGATAFSLADNDGYLYDNLLYPSLPGNQILDWGGILISPAGYPGFYLNVFGGDFGGPDWLQAPDNVFFYFADNNYYSNNPIYAVTGGPAVGTLVATPEPGSLFLLGTGLFGLAFVMFRKAKSSGLV